MLKGEWPFSKLTSSHSEEQTRAQAVNKQLKELTKY
jgi:hypothetical protein